MIEFLGNPLLRASLLMAILLLLLAFAIVCVRKLRGGADEDIQNPSDLLAKFREMRFRGHLSDEEFRTIKTKLSQDTQVELKDNDEKG